MFLDFAERLFADVMLDAAGILCGGLFINTEIYECLCEYTMALVYAFGGFGALFGQKDLTILTDCDKALLLQALAKL